MQWPSEFTVISISVVRDRIARNFWFHSKNTAWPLSIYFVVVFLICWNYGWKKKKTTVVILKIGYNIYGFFLCNNRTQWIMTFRWQSHWNLNHSTTISSHVIRTRSVIFILMMILIQLTALNHIWSDSFCTKITREKNFSTWLVNKSYSFVFFLKALRDFCSFSSNSYRTIYESSNGSLFLPCGLACAKKFRFKRAFAKLALCLVVRASN